MANRFISFLETVGKDIEKGIEKAAPFLFAAGQTLIPLLAPGLAPAFSVVAGVVIQTEQKYAALGKQQGSGVQKLADATAILGPALSQLLSVAGKQADDATVQAYINAVVQFLNAVPVGLNPAPVSAPVA